jgi:5'-nucleotidase
VRVLLTNDDGIDADGLLAIRAALSAICDSVITVAPESDCSGFARKSTFARPVGVARVSGGQHPIYRCDGTPTDCVRAGLLGGLATSADLVVSGINHGANLADDVVYSGTVGAGLEAAILGTPAICLSQQTPTGSFSVNYREDLARVGLAYDFGFAAQHGAALARAVLLARPAEPVVLNVNYPARHSAATAGGPGNGSAVMADAVSVLTRAGRRDYPRAAQANWADGDVHWMYLFGEPDEIIPETEGSLVTDVRALRAGHISVTPLSFAVELSDLSPGFESFIDRVANTFPLAGVYAPEEP